MNSFKYIIVSVVLLSVFKAKANDNSSYHLETPPDINHWGYEIAFGSQPYMDTVFKINFLTPYVFSGSRGSNWRISLDLNWKSVSAYSLSHISEYSISMEQNSRIYKDLIYSFLRFGLGVMAPNSILYDGQMVILPVNMGFQLVTMNTSKGVLSYFVDYRFALSFDFDKNKTLPQQPNSVLERRVFFEGIIATGIRLTF